MQGAGLSACYLELGPRTAVLPGPPEPKASGSAMSLTLRWRDEVDWQDRAQWPWGGRAEGWGSLLTAMWPRGLGATVPASEKEQRTRAPVVQPHTACPGSAGLPCPVLGQGLGER